MTGAWDFHHYERHEILYGRFRRKRLAGLESQAAEALAHFVAGHRASLALSFGKDSMTLLHIAHKRGLLDAITLVLYCHSGIETPDTLAMRDYVVERYGVRQFVQTEPPLELVRATLAKADLAARKPVADFVHHCLERPRWAAMDAHDMLQ